MHMKSRLEGAGVPVSDIPIQPMGMAVLEGSLSPGYRRRMSKIAASPPLTTAEADTPGEDAVAADSSAADADDSPASPSHPQPSVPPIDLSNFVVTMSMASHSLQVALTACFTRANLFLLLCGIVIHSTASPSPLPLLPPPTFFLPSPQSPPRFDSRIDGVVPGSPRGMPVWDLKAQLQQDALVREEWFGIEGVTCELSCAETFWCRRMMTRGRAVTRTLPWTCCSMTTAAETCPAGALHLRPAPRLVHPLADASLCRDGDELARERERKMKLLEKQMGAVLKTVPTVPPKPRRGDFNSAM